MDQVKFVEDSLQKILHGPLLNTLPHFTVLDLFTLLVHGERHTEQQADLA